ncbi:MAG TPA: nucleoside triphosphate pyrophosphohydrolase [Alphaproteobacteria bacterium]|nr:nucleoside triphosphate pyrophosphohydrolase [Alphaproteobacteria bacterium]
MPENLNKLAGIAKLLAVMARLRDSEKGCPWDVEQDFATITKYTLEEVYEVVEAIERQDMPALKEELGDLLFQIVFYAQMASEKSLFDFEQIAQSTADKMIERHPHVFEGKKLEDVEALMKMWEADKAAAREEKAKKQGKTPSLLDDVGSALPALTRAVKLQSRAARGGFEWKSVAPIFEKLDEEIIELKKEVAEKEKTKEPLPLDLVERLTEELGDVLFVAANIGRVLKIDPELALRMANRKFERRFQAIEAALAAQNRKPQDASLQELTDLWNKVRKAKS